MAKDITGNVTVFEVSDGGSGDTAKTLWQFFIDKQPITTQNHFLAETIRIALELNSQVQVTFDEKDPHVMSRARIAFQYSCETRRLAQCKPAPQSE